jgi:drug/metabolite transporter (DMT)-like permease
MRSRTLPLAGVALVSQLTGLVIVAVWVLAAGKGPPSIGDLAPAAVAGAAGVVGLGAFYRGLAIGTMSIVAPISAAGAVVPVVVGLAGGDRPSAVQTVGIVMAVLGVILASREVHEDEGRAADARRSVLLALTAAVGFGVFLALVKPAADHSVPWALLTVRAASILLILTVLATVRPPVGAALSRAAVPSLVAVGALDVFANILYGVATTKGLLSIVSVLGDLYPVTTVLMARAVLRERVRRSQEAGIVAVLAGVALIAAG